MSQHPKVLAAMHEAIVSDAQNQASMIAAPRTGTMNNRWSKNKRLLHLLTTAYGPSRRAPF
jgi:hypothetical protein